MKISGFSKIVGHVFFCVLLASCAGQNPVNEPVVSSDNTAQKQYMCVSKIYLSDVTKAFLLPLDNNGKDHFQIGILLDKLVQNIFWVNSSAAFSGRPPPMVTIGFDGGTGAFRDRNLYVRASLQFQVFKATGQSYMDVVVGEASSSSVSNPSDSAVVNAALQQALNRLAGTLSSAGICQAME